MTDEVERMIDFKLEVLSSNHVWVTVDKKLDLHGLLSHINFLTLHSEERLSTPT